MQGLLHDTRERAIIQSVLKIEGEPKALIGMQFFYRPPGKVDLERVEVIAEAESGRGFRVKRVNGDGEFDDVEACQLTIGKGRLAGKPLMQLLNRHGFETEPYLQRDEFRTPASRSGSASSAQRRGGPIEEGTGGFRPVRPATPVTQGLGPERVGSAQANYNVRGPGGEWAQRRGSTPFGYPDMGEGGVGRPTPYAPAPLRSPQVSVQGNFGVGNLNPFENQYQQFARRTQLQQPANPQYGQQLSRSICMRGSKEV